MDRVADESSEKGKPVWKGGVARAVATDDGQGFRVAGFHGPSSGGPFSELHELRGLKQA